VDIADWLRRLGLDESVFRDNDLDLEMLPSLTADDLRELGVISLGHRKKLLTAIAALSPTGGSDLEEDDRTSPLPKTGASQPPTKTGRAERRQLTVMFADLVGSTALSARLDPEDMREVLGAYHQAVAAAVTRFGGHIAKLMGDGVLVYFGWPQAHEDEAERAVRGGLAVVEAVERLDKRSAGALSARVGIATGLVVVGDLIGEGAAQEEAVVGETPNLAARLQQLAEPGAVVIAESTRRLLGRWFALTDLGSQQIRGIEVPAPAFRVLGEAASESRFEALRRADVGPLIGREHELALLLDRWETAKGGEGQVVLLSGEAGIGKSRIVLALRERLRNEPRFRIGYSCSPHHVNSALWPVVVQLQRAAGYLREDGTLVEAREVGAAPRQGRRVRRGRGAAARRADGAAAQWALRGARWDAAGEKGAALRHSLGANGGARAPAADARGPGGRALARSDVGRAFRADGGPDPGSADTSRRHYAA
jgi:class 3 adenylate cyclase